MKILEFLSVNNSIPVVVVIVAGFVVTAFVQSYYIMQGKVGDIKESTKGKIEKIIDDVVLDIEETLFVSGSEAMSSQWSDVATCVHGETSKSCDFIGKYYTSEAKEFRVILHNALTRTKASIVTHVRINGFIKMPMAELDSYCNEVGSELAIYTERALRIKGIDTLQLLKGTDWLTFDDKEATMDYKRIISNVIRVRKEETRMVESVKKKLTINDVLVSFFKGYVNG